MDVSLKLVQKVMKSRLGRPRKDDIETYLNFLAAVNDCKTVQAAALAVHTPAHTQSTMFDKNARRANRTPKHRRKWRYAMMDGKVVGLDYGRHPLAQ